MSIEKHLPLAREYADGSFAQTTVTTLSRCLCFINKQSHLNGVRLLIQQSEDEKHDLYVSVSVCVGRCQKVCVGGGWGGGGGGGGEAYRHVIYAPSVKNQYKRVVFGYMVIY